MILILSSSRKYAYNSDTIKKLNEKKEKKLTDIKLVIEIMIIWCLLFSISGFSLISSLLFSLHYHIIETVYQRTVSLPHPPTHNHPTPPHSHPGCPPPPGITSPTTTICSINSRHRRYNTNSNSSKWWVGPLLLIFGYKFGLFEINSFLIVMTLGKRE